MTIDTKNGQDYSPWMQNWEKDYKNPKEQKNSPLQNKYVKLLLWVGFFGLLVSPIVLILLSFWINGFETRDNKSVTFSKSDSNRLIEETENAIHLGRYNIAIQRANYLISEDPDIPKIYVLAGLAYFYWENYNEASDFANEALKLNPHYTAAKYLLAMCTHEIGQTNNVKLDYADDYVYSYFFASLYNELLQNHKEMLNIAEEAMQNFPRSHLARYLLAKAQFLNMQFKKALSTINSLTQPGLTENLASNSIWMRASMIKVEILWKLDRNDEAHKTLMSFYDSYPDCWATIETYAQMLNSQSKFSQTVKLLNVFLSPRTTKNQNYNVIKMYQLRGFAQFKVHNFEQALKDYQNLVLIEAGISDFNDIGLVKSYLTPVCHSALLRISLINQIKGNSEASIEIAKLIDKRFLSFSDKAEYENLMTKIHE